MRKRWLYILRQLYLEVLLKEAQINIIRTEKECKVEQVLFLIENIFAHLNKLIKWEMDAARERGRTIMEAMPLRNEIQGKRGWPSLKAQTSHQ